MGEVNVSSHSSSSREDIRSYFWDTKRKMRKLRRDSCIEYQKETGKQYCKEGCAENSCGLR